MRISDWSSDVCSSDLRLVDAAARQIGLSAAVIRRRDFIPPEAMPYETCLGSEYDSGEVAKNMEDALARGDWDGFEARRAESAKRGKLRGIGLSSYIEACGGGMDENATITFDESGHVTVHVGSQSNGQGHETAYSQHVAEIGRGACRERGGQYREYLGGAG